MLQDDDKSIAIIDFGISSVVEEGNTVLVTKTVFQIAARPA